MELEIITGVAIMVGNNTFYSLPKPNRHHNVFDIIDVERPDLIINNLMEKQGFITSKGRFVDRKEGLLIASTANQLIRKTQPLYLLFSEDMW